ncbi:MAG: PLDc_N domain-containing protein [Chloroflexi bacterium]|nr:PLDc_N domain-containing protein [Chloroflexota bacterium]
MDDGFQVFLEALPFLVPLILIEVALLVIALVDLVRREQVRGGNKLIWALVIIFIEVIGPVLYLVLGRKEKAVDGD